MDGMKTLVLYWKRGIVLYLAGQVLAYVIGLIFGIGNQILESLGRASLVGGITSILVSWVVAPVIMGWLISSVVNKIK